MKMDLNELEVNVKINFLSKGNNNNQKILVNVYSVGEFEYGYNIFYVFIIMHFYYYSFFSFCDEYRCIISIYGEIFMFSFLFSFPFHVQK